MLVIQRILDMIFTFPKIVKELLSKFSTRDYSVLNTRLFISCWLGFSLDQSLRSMRDLFKRLHQGGIPMDISCRASKLHDDSCEALSARLFSSRTSVI
jgi:hypothetical protein